METHDTIYNLQEVADLLRASKETVVGYVRTGELPAGRIGKNLIFLPKDVLAFVEAIVARHTAERQRRHNSAPPDLVVPAAPRRSRRNIPPALPGGAEI